MKRVLLYNEGIFSCKYTGRGGLTFEEALHEEQKALGMLRKVRICML